MKKGSKTPFIAAPRLRPVEAGFRILEYPRGPSDHGRGEAHIVDAGVMHGCLTGTTDKNATA